MCNYSPMQKIIHRRMCENKKKLLVNRFFKFANHFAVSKLSIIICVRRDFSVVACFCFMRGRTDTTF